MSETTHVCAHCGAELQPDQQVIYRWCDIIMIENGDTGYREAETLGEHERRFCNPEHQQMWVADNPSHQVIEHSAPGLWRRE